LRVALPAGLHLHRRPRRHRGTVGPVHHPAAEVTGGPALSSGVMDITIGGAGIAGMAAAARLARLGHRVVLASDGGALGGRWAPAPAGDDVGGHVVDAMPQVVRLPATWRDLFKKSGGHLQTELNRAGLE